MDFFKNYIQRKMGDAQVFFLLNPRVPQGFGYTEETCPQFARNMSIAALEAMWRMKSILQELQELGFSIDAQKVSEEMDRRMEDEYELYERLESVDWYPKDENGNWVDSPYLKPEGGVNWDYVEQEEVEYTLMDALGIEDDEM